MLSQLKLLKQNSQPKTASIESEIASKLPTIIQELGITTKSYKCKFKTVRYYAYKTSPLSPALLIKQCIENNCCTYIINLYNIHIFTAHTAAYFTLDLPVDIKQIILNKINTIYDSILTSRNNKEIEMANKNNADINKIIELCNTWNGENK